MEPNKKIAAAAVQAKDLALDKAEARSLNGATKDRPTPEMRIGLAAQVAENITHSRNWKFKNADKHFPHEPLLRRCDKFFPYAKGGPLLVDEPATANDVKDCQRKATALAKEGLRYCYITKDMKLADALKQLAPKKVA